MAPKVDSNKSLRTRFITSMVIMLLPLIVLAYGAYSSLQSALNALEEVIETNVARVGPLQQLQLHLKGVQEPLAEFLVDGNATRHTQAFERTATDINTLFSNEVLTAFELDRAVPVGGERRRSEAVKNDQDAGLVSGYLIRLRAARALWKAAEETARGMFALNPDTQRGALDRELQILQADLKGAANRIAAVQDQVVASIKGKKHFAGEVHRGALMKIGLIFVLGLVVALIIAVALARSVLVPLRELEHGVEKFGEGELTHRVNIATQDEIHRLGMAFNEMADKLRQTQEMLEDLSTHDDLTGLYNYREFQRRLKAEVDRARRYGRPLSLLMLDIDHFKQVNDTYGHQSGDVVLEKVSQTMLRAVRPVDRVARCGGEEFSLILPETPIESALSVAERLRARIADEQIPVPGSDEPIRITVSVGVACFAIGVATGQHLISAADKALYAAKNGGRNQVQEASLEAEMEEA